MADQALVVTEDDVRAMLLAGDSIVGQAGRSMLAKVLKGSRDKKLLAIGLDKSAGYGYFRSLTLDQITERVDWMILHDFFAIDYDRDMPLLVFTDRGWEIQIENMTELMLKQWEMWADTVPQDLDMTYLKDLNRSMILLFLEKVARTHDARYLPLLRQWAPIDYRKVREAIGKVIDYLEQGNSESPLMLEGAHRSFYYTAWRAPHRAAWQRTSEVLGVRQKIRVDCRGAGQVPHARLETSKAMRIVPREAPWTARGLVVNA